MSEELKPCPFCGAVAESRWGYARCADLSCAGWHWVEIAAWNTRPAVDQQVAAAPAPALPEGWVAVPVEPTREMLEAMANTVPCMTNDAKLAYHAMLSAAPSLPADDLEAMRRDAARYRWLRDGCDNKWTEATRIAARCYGIEWDAAIDAAMAQEDGDGR